MSTPSNKVRTANLAVQGGGMRGVYSMGALETIALSPTIHLIDEIVASSAGALNAHYVVSGQPDLGVSMYVDDLSCRDFIDPRRFWKIVDIDFLIDEVQKRRRPMDLAAFRGSEILLKTVVTNADTAEGVVITNRDEDDPHEVMRATAALPVLYNQRVPLAGRGQFVDGGLDDSLPVFRALESQPDLLIAVTTRTLGYRSTPRPLWYRVGGHLTARGQSTPIKRAIASVNQAFNDALDYLEHTCTERLWQSNGSFIARRPDGGLAALVTPSDQNDLVSRTTFDREELQRCAHLGRNDMSALLTALNRLDLL